MNPGILFPGAIYDNVPLWPRTPNVSNFSSPMNLPTAILTTYGSAPITPASAKTPKAPVVPAIRNLLGFDSFLFGHDWYNRVHVLPTTLSLGALLSTQVKTIEVWNAFFTPQALSSITKANNSGITDALSYKDYTGATIPVSSFPFTAGALQDMTLTLSISLTGPANINASYTFNFPTQAPVLTVTGERVIVFSYAPDWSDKLVESHEWKTDILQSYDGSEQRVALRKYPRRALKYSVLTTDQYQSNRLDTLLLGWQGRVYAVPVWTDVQSIAASLPAGSLSVPCTTSGYEFLAGDAVILYQSHDTYETVQVATVGGSSLTFSNATQNTWPAGTKLYPARLARLASKQTLSRETDMHNRGSFEFMMDDNRGFTAADPGAVYQGFPVLTITPNWDAPLNQDFVRKLNTLDYDTCVRWVDDESGLANLLKDFHWLFSSRAEITAFRSWLYYRVGAQVPFWSESQGSDLVLTAPIAVSDTSIQIQNINYALLINAATHRRDIAIHTTSGAVYYRRITGASVVDATHESLGLDSALGVNLTVAQVSRISFMSLCRLEADRVDINWTSDQIADCNLILRGLPA